MPSLVTVTNQEVITKGIKISFSTSITHADVSGIKLYKNGTVDMGSLTVTGVGTDTLSITTTSAITLLASDFIVINVSNMATGSITDKDGNSAMMVNSAIGGPGSNTINLTTLSEVHYADGKGGNDTITGTSSNDGIDGGSGNDTLLGGGGIDFLVGGAGNDFLDGGDDNDGMWGGTGNDTFIVRQTGDAVVENANEGIDLVKSYATDVTLSDNVEYLRMMTTGAATGTGNALDNMIYSGAGDDTLHGMAGNDTLNYSFSTTGVTIDVAAGTATGNGNDTFDGFELYVGSNYNDMMTGGATDDILSGRKGDDTISGGDGNDTLRGDAGNDMLNGGNGNDALFGGAGIDTASYADAASGVTVTLTTLANQDTGGAGIDKLVGIESLIGSAFNDTLTGGAGNNRIDGGDGDDIINGGAGADTLIGGNGVDTVTYATANSAVTVNLGTTGVQNTKGWGFDTLSGFENLVGSIYGDTLTGTAGDNNIDGLAGDDIIDASAGNDTINGGFGNDTIYGGGGNDTITLGGGSDIVIFNSLLKASNVDTITDFAPVYDTIQLKQDIFGELAVGTLSASNFAINATGTAENGNACIIYNTSTGSLSYDADGNGTAFSALEFAVLGTATHPTNVTAADFVII